jgi:hypothetical protein
MSNHTKCSVVQYLELVFYILDLSFKFMLGYMGLARGLEQFSCVSLGDVNNYEHLISCLECCVTCCQ